jgi:RNA polymerase sigma factor (sigma-70 family)
MGKVDDDRALWLVRRVLPHEPALRAWLNGRQPPGLEVDDIIQETYSRLIATESVAKVRNVKGYTFQTAYSVIASHLRRAKVVSFQTFSDMDSLSAGTSELSPEAHAVGFQDLQQLALAIARLPGRVRDVFVLRRIEGLSQREVGQKLAIAESTVEKHMSRGLLLLIEAFGGRGSGDPARIQAQANLGEPDAKAKQSRD